MQKTKYDLDGFATSLANMMLAIAVSLLLCAEFSLGWYAGFALYILIFNFMRAVDKVAKYD